MSVLDRGGGGMARWRLAHRVYIRQGRMDKEVFDILFSRALAGLQDEGKVKLINFVDPEQAAEVIWKLSVEEYFLLSFAAQKDPDTHFYVIEKQSGDGFLYHYRTHKGADYWENACELHDDCVINRRSGHVHYWGCA